MTQTIPDWYLADSLRAIGRLSFIQGHLTDEQILRAWRAYMIAAPDEHEDVS